MHCILFSTDSATHISLEKTIELSSTTDIFFSHNWGVDEKGRDTHKRIGKLNESMKERGLITWYDAERMRGSVVEKMCSGIDRTQIVLIGITKSYVTKVSGDKRDDNCKLEFQYSVSQKSPDFMIPIVLEPSMLNQKLWTGPVGMYFSTFLYCDMTSDDPETWERQCNNLYNMIVNTIRPRFISIRTTVGTIASSPIPKYPRVTAQAADIADESKPLKDLSVDEVCCLMEHINLSAYKAKFKEEEVHGEMLTYVNKDDDLIQMGITLPLKARYFFGKIKEYKEHGVPLAQIQSGSVAAATTATPVATTCGGSISAAQGLPLPPSPRALELSGVMRVDVSTVVRELKVALVSKDGSGLQRALSLIDDTISRTDTQRIVAVSGVVSDLRDIIENEASSSSSKWLSARILAILCLNKAHATEVECLGGRKVIQQQHWRCSGTSNASLVRNLIQADIVKSIIVAAVMLSIDRGNYAPTEPYDDCPQRIGHGAKPLVTTISAPHMHAHALQNLCGSVVVRDARILDVGCGSGYLTAAFARLNPYSQVYGIDHMIELVQLSNLNMRKSDGDLLDSGRVHLQIADAWDGYAPGAPYDLIHVGAAAATVPTNLLLQMKIGGKMFIPVGPDGGNQKLLFIERSFSGSDLEKDFTFKELMGVRYVPLVNVKNQK